MEPEARCQIPNTSAVQNADVYGFRFVDVAILLLKRRRFIVASTMAAGILAAVVSFLLPCKYTAMTKLLPPSQGSSSASMLLGQLGGSPSLAAAAGASLGIKNVGDQYVSFLHSRTVEDAVVQRFELSQRYHAKTASDARSAFEKHTSVVNGIKDGLITIEVTDIDPNMAANIANGYVEEYRKFTSGLAITEASQRRLYFQQQLQEARERLSAAEDSFEKSEQTTGVLQIDGQMRSLIESSAAIRAQVVSKEVQLHALESYATDDNPQVTMLRQQLSELQAQLSKEGTVDPDSGMILPKGKVSAISIEYLRKLRDVKYAETVADLIAKQYEMAKLDESRHGAFTQVVDVAVVPDKRSSPKRVPIVVMTAVMSFFLVCLWSVFQERWLRFKNDPVARQSLDSFWASIRA